MHLESENLQRLKKFAKLDFSTEGSLSPLTDLNNVLACFDKILDLNTDSVAPLIYPNQSSLKMRDDIAEPSLSIEEIKQNAPQFKDGFFIFPGFLSQKKKEGWA